MKLSERVRIVPVDDKMRETRLKWFGHIKRRDINAIVRSCEWIDLPGCQER